LEDEPLLEAPPDAPLPVDEPPAVPLPEEGLLGAELLGAVLEEDELVLLGG